MENHKAGGMCDEKWKYLIFFYSSFEEKIKAWKFRWIKTRFYLKEVDKYKDKNSQQMMPLKKCLSYQTPTSLSAVFIPGHLPKVID